MSKVEEVARAMRRRKFEHLGVLKCYDSELEPTENELDDARAAIAAAEAWNTKAGYVTVPREPTEAMVNADFDGPNRRLPITGEEVIDIWRAMIDKALSE